MSKLLPLVCAICCSVASAETVLWKAQGAVTSATGVYQDIESDTEVELRITYNDQAAPDVFTNIFGRVETESRTDIALTFEIKIDDQTWDALVTTANNGSPRTLVTKASPNAAERVEMLITSADNGTFPNFPLGTSEGTDLIDLDFASSTNTFITSGISATSFEPGEITTATGTIQTGSTSNKLSFSITPETVEILNEDDEAVPPIAPLVSSTVSGDSISLSWLSDIRFRYRIEGTSDLSADDWTEVETRNGTSTPITRSYPLANTFRFYRVVAIER